MINKNEIQEQIVCAVDAAKRTNPLVGSVTNSVTINFVANAQLAVGGSAAMVYLDDEGEFLAGVGGAFYINIGTILPLYEQSLPHIARKLHEFGKPWVLDPVAVGIGTLRSSILTQFKAYKPSIIRGNASEIIALAGLWGLDKATKSNVRGVDSTDAVTSAKASAIALAKWTGGAVAVSGATDLVTDGSVVVFSHGGSHYFEKITGAGCSLGGVAAIYAAVATPFVAALCASAICNLAGQRAEQKAAGPGSFQSEFLDELYKATPEDVANNHFEIEEI
ncbi:MAG: hydroxyethylthiazole kinase [Dehalococcoidia bacterium]|nr:hydroxyethylthiazole kinase [Dehalococcoidia bacterium]MCL2615209.1 hydroxyethylthiazole kinase [Dehalococcoidia bacterium]